MEEITSQYDDVLSEGKRLKAKMPIFEEYKNIILRLLKTNDEYKKLDRFFISPEEMNDKGIYLERSEIREELQTFDDRRDR